MGKEIKWCVVKEENGFAKIKGKKNLNI